MALDPLVFPSPSDNPSTAPTIVQPRRGKKPRLLQALTPNIVKYLQKTVLQQKAKFDFMIFRNPADSVGGLATVGAAFGVGADVFISKVYTSSLTFNQIKFIYERINGDIYVKDIEYPDSIMLKFIDDEKGLVMRYLQEWFDKVATPDSFLVPNPTAGYVFRDNQEAAKRTGILLLANQAGGIPIYPRITFYGMTPMNFSDITVGQDEQGNITYDVQIAVREPRISIFI